MVKTALIAAIALVLGVILGFFAGRSMLERQWSSPFVTVSASDAKSSSSEGADPTPKEGSSVMIPLPLGRARLVAKAATAKDPLVMTVGAVGRGDEGAELHLVLDNRGKCNITGFEGTAYAYDAWGKPAKANKGGEDYVAFSAKDQHIAPGESTLFVEKLKYPDTASLAVAMVDKVSCADGTTWKRQ
jgi:hypothetical protein